MENFDKVIEKTNAIQKYKEMINLINNKIEKEEQEIRELSEEYEKEYDCSPYTRASRFTPLMHNILNDDDLKKEYLKYINMKNSSGWTALMIVARNSDGNWSSKCSDELVKRLLKEGADPNIKTEYGATALMFAARNTRAGSTENTVQILLNNGADPNIQDKDGTTALMFAAKYANIYSTKNTIQILLNNGADTNIQDKNGTTALMFAIFSNNYDVVKLLLEKGADETIENDTCERAIDLASGEIKKLLSEYKWISKVSKMEKEIEELRNQLNGFVEK